MCWAATDGICSKRLAPFLPELLERLGHWHALRHVSPETIARVASMSAATVDRALPASRDGLPKRGLSTTRPGTLLKHQVAIKTFADWSETVPGFVDVDLVAHCGWTGAGPFLYTLTLGCRHGLGQLRRPARQAPAYGAQRVAHHSRWSALPDSGSGRRQWR